MPAPGSSCSSKVPRVGVLKDHMRLDITKTNVVASHVVRDQQRKILVPNDDKKNNTVFF